jgi:hypothetical protein
VSPKADAPRGTSAAGVLRRLRHDRPLPDRRRTARRFGTPGAKNAERGSSPAPFILSLFRRRLKRRVYGNGRRLLFAKSMNGPGTIPSTRVARAQKATAPTRAGARSGAGVVWSESLRYMKTTIRK